MPKIPRSITSALSAALSFSRYWLLLGLLGILLARPVMGSSQQDSFRISRLETELRSLQSQLNQLGGQINRLQRRDGVIAPADLRPAIPPTAEAPNYDQLATLVIETRQDMFALEERLAQLERALGDASPNQGTP